MLHPLPHRELVLGLTLLCLGCRPTTPPPSTPPAPKKATFAQSWRTLSFSTPVPFSAPTKLGLDAVTLLHPPTARLADAKFSIILVELGPGMQKELGMDEAGLLDYVKTTFLGTSLPATAHKERAILGRASRGALIAQTIPRPSRLEAHLLPLAGGTRIALAFRHDETMPTAEAGAIIEAVCSSLVAR